MPSLRSTLLAACAVLAVAAPARSQQTQERPVSGFDFSRYVSVLAGAAFAAQTTPTISGEYGEWVSDHVMAYMSYSFYENLMSSRMRSNLVLAGDVLTEATGSERVFSGRDRGLALTAGGRFVVPLSAVVRPYIGAGGGVLHLRRRITEQGLGDVTSSFVTESGLNDGIITSGADATKKGVAEAVFGANIVAGRTYVDVGYRFRRAFHAHALDFSQFSVGVGVTF
jgi:hypothetical protein